MKVGDVIHCGSTEEVREVLKALWCMGNKYYRAGYQECNEEYLTKFEVYKAIFIRDEGIGLGGNREPNGEDAMSYKEFMDKYSNRKTRLLKALMKRLTNGLL